MIDWCQWLHQALEPLPLARWPIEMGALPRDGIYFFYENGEVWGHGRADPRIVRVGTHRDGNFRNRIREHFGPEPEAVRIDRDRPGPKDRSIFRKNLGRALLHRTGDDYLEVWNIDFTTHRSRDAAVHRRDVAKEAKVEAEVSDLLRQRFALRFVPMQHEALRMGETGLERRLIGTLAACGMCRPSASWLGAHSPLPAVARSGLWLSQHLGSEGLDAEAASLLTAEIQNYEA